MNKQALAQVISLLSQMAQEDPEPTRPQPKKRGRKPKVLPMVESNPQQFSGKDIQEAEDELFNVPNPDEEVTSQVPSYEDYGGGSSLMDGRAEMADPTRSIEGLAGELHRQKVRAEVLAQRFLQLERLVVEISNRVSGRSSGADFGR